jgi:hypothetical protein
MRRGVIIGALVLVCVGIVLEATVFRTDVAQATGLAQSVDATIINPLDTGNLRVHEEGTARTSEQNTDANGNVKVHEQGTVQISPTLPPEADFSTSATGSAFLGATKRVTLIAVDMAPSAEHVSFSPLNFRLLGPAQGGQEHYVLALTQPLPVNGWGEACSQGAMCVKVSVAGSG